MKTTTVATATASGTVALSLVVLVQWVLSLYKISLPADVATALATIVAAGVHWFVVKKGFGLLPVQSTTTPVEGTKA